MRPRLSRYEVLGRLATGGMAEVWLARAVGPGGFEKRVVLKTILPQFAQAPQFTQMFIDEARVAAMLSHPNCVSIFDLGDEGGTLFIAMEYIEGFSLSRLLRRAEATGAEVPIKVIARVAMDACSGLEYAHKLTDRDGKPLGLIHRDVSPDNLLVAFSGQTKLVDFGIAKAAATKVGGTRTGTVKGKFGYMAPEYLRGEKTDHRADLFALGVVLYRALTGRKPFNGPTEAMISKAVLDIDPPPPSSLKQELAPLDALVMRALHKDPLARWSSARAMRADIEAALGAVPDDEAVGQWFNVVCPAEDPERLAMTALANGKGGDGSEPALESVVSESEDVDLGTASVGTPGHAQTAPRTGVQRSPRLLRVAALALVAVATGATVLAFRGTPFKATDVATVTPAPAVAPPDEPEPEPAAVPPEPEDTETSAPAPATKKARSGRLEVATTPAVSVSYKGKLLGRSPGTFEVPAGAGAVRLFDKSLGLEKTVSVRVSVGETEKVKLTFGKAKLEVRVAPWANVKLDGKVLGQTPIAPVEVWEGTHVLELENPELKQKKRLELKLAADEVKTVREALQ